MNGLRHRADSTALILVALVAVVVAGMTTAQPASRYLPVALTTALFVTGIVAIHPKFAIPILFGSSTIGLVVLTTPAGGLRPDQLLVIPVLAGVLARKLLVGSEIGIPRLGVVGPLVALLLGCLIVLNLLFSITESPDTTSSMRIVIWLSFSLLSFISASLSTRWFGTPDDTLTSILGVGVISCGLATCLFLLGLVGTTTFGTETASFAAREGTFTRIAAKGTFLEPNLLGAFSAFATIGCVFRARQHRPVYGIPPKLAVLICMSALAVSQTRTAWIAMPLGLFAAFCFESRSLRFRLKLIISAIGAYLLYRLGASVSWTHDLPVSIYSDNTGTAAHRLSITSDAYASFLETPLIGHGTNSYVQTHFDQHTRLGYLAGQIISALYDTGLVGFLLILATYSLIFFRLSRCKDEWLSDRSALAGGIVALLICNQSTNGFWFSFQWIILACAVAYGETATSVVSHAKRSSPFIARQDREGVAVQ